MDLKSENNIKDRILPINKTDKKTGSSVVYVMSRDQRVKDNFALIDAQNLALKLKQPLLVIFNLKNYIKNRSREHFNFMLEGLREVKNNLEKINIEFILSGQGSRVELDEILSQINPSNIYFDFSPFYNHRVRIKQLAKKINVNAFMVDNHNIIPAWIASSQQEFAARTFRFKVKNNLEQYLIEPGLLKYHQYKKLKTTSLSIDEAFDYINLYPARNIKFAFKSGESAARDNLDYFISHKLIDYAEKRNDFANDFQSNLSPHLHFGQISSLRVSLEIIKAVGREPHQFESAIMPKITGDNLYDGMNALFEEMIVRKELSDNYCLYNNYQRSLKGAPDWARKSLDKHRLDKREYIYTLDQFEQSQTHDEIWNAAQKELTKTGKMHGYMRMYWAKKILEWTNSPEEALEYCIYLNDAYSIDGYDPNGYVGILWSIAGLHDRPWQEREVFGMIRYMNDQGLMRKFDVKQYIEKINKIN